MSEKWVDGSGRSGAFLDPRDHLLQDPAAEAKFGFTLAHAWEAAQQGLLLDNTAVFLTPGRPGSILFGRQQTHALPCCSSDNLGASTRLPVQGSLLQRRTRERASAC